MRSKQIVNFLSRFPQNILAKNIVTKDDAALICGVDALDFSRNFFRFF
jgi:hypothetical protein